MAIAHATHIRPALLNVTWQGLHSVPPIAVSKVGTPAAPFRGLVRLHHQPSGRVVAEAWSDSEAGTETLFDRIAAGVYYVVAFDHTGQYDGVIAADVVVPAPGA
jgi:hypothetical protein